MGNNVASAKVEEIRPYLALTQRLNELLNSIDNKTKSFQISLEQVAEKTPSAQSEFEDRLKILVERAQNIDDKLSF